MSREASQPGSLSRENAEHYRWGDDCDGWHLVKSDDLSVIEELIPSGAAEARQPESPAVFLHSRGRSVDGSCGSNHLTACRRGNPRIARNASPDQQSVIQRRTLSRDLTPPSHGDRFTE
jgi:hypothetical protein